MENGYFERIPQDDQLQKLVLVVYILQAVALMAGVTAIIGVIINYIKRAETRDTLWESHFQWQIRTFWWGLLGFVVGGATIWLMGIGFLILGITWVWYVYRVIRGFLAYNDRRELPM